ncbi:MAG: hypothetical protein JWR56_1019 [Massilia sp.]|nr:hypothetical protein [Massilia sp.]
MTTISNARAATDTRHRIALPNSQPRRIMLIGLGKGEAAIVDALDLAPLHGVEVVPADPARLTGAEMICTVACAGDDLSIAPEILRVAHASNVMVTGILLDQGDTHAELPKLRAASDILIIARDASYVADMLAQLGA